MTRSNVEDYMKILSALEVIGITVIIIIDFYFQFSMHNMVKPISLILLQRLGLLAMGFGFLLNTHFHIRPSHYALSLLASVFTLLVSLKIISIHMLDPIGIGPRLFGVHMYSWVFIVSIIYIIYIAIVMSFSEQYDLHEKTSKEVSEHDNKAIRIITHIIFAIFVILAIISIGIAYHECGFGSCSVIQESANQAMQAAPILQ
ncbi:MULTISPECIES: disulfide bond formation protein B [unclassified Francisella]|uniref:disulfide bond formation protein B n=1 Tax=unclassified Francisella TaxID=2610885 RepID=UPI002E36BC84|nr:MULTISPECIES: disulfide bond formation protein B [unclassified Francisella]MED7820190.1 disulfide bond formation protein B [Francisella sp. 19S2-4]MED7831010.1 disulfide bond formation protein B [Francisella sp. 19S2-10]